MNRAARTLASALALAVVGALGGSWPSASSAGRQTDACLHGTDETAAEKQRRTQAVLLARFINKQEQVARSSGGSFVALKALPGALPPAQGFEAGLVTDGSTYAFSVKDTLDPCGHAFFSDHNGLIYEGKALR
jgi:hypothetical protein